MSIRTINYEVRAGEITPKTEQSAGLQGESNVTDIVFTLDFDLHYAIAKEEGETRYRIQATDGAGAFYSSEFLTYNGTKRTLTFPIGTELSAAGGVAYLHLVISKLLDSGEENILYSFPARVRFDSTPTGGYLEREYCNSITGALYAAQKAEINAEEACKAALTAAKHAELAMGKTELARAAMESGVEYIFLGGDSTSSFDVDLVVDDQLSEVSENPVQNGVISARLNSLKTQADALEGLAVRRGFIGEAGYAENISLMDWCDTHVRDGVQLIQIGEGALDTPAKYCLGLYLCNGGDRRTIIIIAPGGTTYTRAYVGSLDGWQSWCRHSGEVITL